MEQYIACHNRIGSVEKQEKLVLAAKLIMGLILICAMGLGIACFVPKLDAFGWSATCLTLIVFISCLWKLMVAEKIKTVQLCAVVVLAYATLFLGHYYKCGISKAIGDCYRMIYGTHHLSGVGSLSIFFWLGLVLLSTAELYRKPDAQFSVPWKIYAVLALVNSSVILSYGFFHATGVDR